MTQCNVSHDVNTARDRQVSRREAVYYQVRALLPTRSAPAYSVSEWEGVGGYGGNKGEGLSARLRREKSDAVLEQTTFGRQTGDGGK